MLHELHTLLTHEAGGGHERLANLNALLDGQHDLVDDALFQELKKPLFHLLVLLLMIGELLRDVPKDEEVTLLISKFNLYPFQRVVNLDVTVESRGSAVSSFTVKKFLSWHLEDLIFA